MALPGSSGSSRSLIPLALLLLAAGSSSACASAGGPRVPGPDQIPSLERTAAANPADVDVRVRLGAAYRAAGRLDDAQRVLESAYAVAPS